MVVSFTLSEEAIWSDAHRSSRYCIALLICMNLLVSYYENVFADVQRNENDFLNLGVKSPLLKRFYLMKTKRISTRPF